MVLVVRMAVVCLAALALHGCAPDTAADSAVVPAGVPAVVKAGASVREQISVNDGIRTRTVYEVSSGIKEITLEENKKDGKLHGPQLRYAKGRLIEEVHYEDGKKLDVKSQEWLDEMNELRSENCILEKTPDHPDPQADGPPVPQATLDQYNARCNERPFASEE